MRTKIIKKYEQFLREAIDVPPPPPGIYYQMPQSTSAETASDTYRLDFSKDTKTPTDTNIIKGSDWGIEGFNPPPIHRGTFKVIPGKDQTGGGVELDAFMKSYRDYMRAADSVGGVGKKLLIFKGGYSAKDGSYYVDIDNRTAMNFDIQSVYKGPVGSNKGDVSNRFAIWTTRKATRQFDLASGQMAIKEQAFDVRDRHSAPGEGEGFNQYTLGFATGAEVVAIQGQYPSNRTISDIKVLGQTYNELEFKPELIDLPNGEISVGWDGTVGLSQNILKEKGLKSNTELNDYQTTYTDQWGQKQTYTLSHSVMWTPAYGGDNIKYNPEGYGTEFHVKKIWESTASGVEYINDSLKNIQVIDQSNPNYKNAGVSVPLETEQYGLTLKEAYRLQQLESVKKPSKQKIIGIKWNAAAKKWEITERPNTPNSGDANVNSGYWMN